MTPRRRWVILTDAAAVMAAHQLLTSAMRSNGDDDWPVHSLMLFLHDLHNLPLRRLPSTVPSIMIFASRVAKDETG